MQAEKAYAVQGAEPAAAAAIQGYGLQALEYADGARSIKVAANQTGEPSDGAAAVLSAYALQALEYGPDGRLFVSMCVST